jgi:hypothetical protein
MKKSYRINNRASTEPCLDGSVFSNETIENKTQQLFTHWKQGGLLLLSRKNKKNQHHLDLRVFGSLIARYSPCSLLHYSLTLLLSNRLIFREIVHR